MKPPFFLFSAISSALLLTTTSYILGPVISHCSMRSIHTDLYRVSYRVNPWSLTMRASRSSNEGGDTKGQKHKSLAPVYYPKTANQKIYCSCLSDPNASIVLGVGPAGTGKTLFACITAIQMLRRGDIHKIVLTRPVVAVEEELGFLPGNMVMKMDPWTRPIFDVFLEYYAQKDVDAMVQSGTIEISPLAYMRGRTFKRAFIIADEMQNSSPNQMLMLITRIGEGSKMVITGDLKQSDRSGENGLNELMTKIGRHQVHYTNETDSVISVGGIRAIELMTQDVERSAIVKQVLALYEEPAVVVREKPNTRSNNTDTANATVSLNKNASASFEMVCVEYTNENDGVDDAALIPKQHSSKHFSGENYGQYSSKWIGW